VIGHVEWPPHRLDSYLNAAIPSVLADRERVDVVRAFEVTTREIQDA